MSWDLDHDDEPPQAPIPRRISIQGGEMSDELKPCPCCDGGAIVCAVLKDGRPGGRLRYTHVVKCDVCALSTFEYNTREVAIENWNNRPLEAKLRADNEELKAKLQEMELRQQRDDQIMERALERAYQDGDREGYKAGRDDDRNR